MTRQTRGFPGNAFHQVAVAGNDPRAMIYDVVFFRVHPRGGHGLSQGHPYAVGNALPQGAGRCLYARDFAVLRVSGGRTMALTKVSQVVDG